MLIARSGVCARKWIVRSIVGLVPGPVQAHERRRVERVAEQRQRERIDRAVGVAQPQPRADFHRPVCAFEGRRADARLKDQVLGERRRERGEIRRGLAQRVRRRDGGICSSLISGALHGTEKAASASAISLPSCSMRADRVLSERPARSITVSMLTGPVCGARA